MCGRFELCANILTPTICRCDNAKKVYRVFGAKKCSFDFQLELQVHCAWARVQHNGHWCYSMYVARGLAKWV